MDKKHNVLTSLLGRVRPASQNTEYLLHSSIQYSEVPFKKQRTVKRIGGDCTRTIVQSILQNSRVQCNYNFDSLIALGSFFTSEETLFSITINFYFN